ncbi:hypothetical protein BLA29_006832 [Euroglyphus maynei]|uniref:Uncharacterized protein n=1 Tax=Euroglyphus maynei TaxID=6958 RepID=A0A1Y3B997_EURMA|nr:hypothetical protein BLA29_006832 [Euroglyphus maynei]
MVVKSDQPTVLIAPSDYEHIFKGGDPETTQKRNEIDVKAKKISSDQPTVMIAPSDYEHIFKGTPAKNESKTGKPIRKIASETPTILIAPSDFQHIYCDPTLQKEDKMKKLIQQPVDDSQQKRDSEQRLRCQHERPKVSNPRQQKEHYTHQQEILPPSIIQIIEKFIAKQKRSYTIQKPKSYRHLQ